MASWTDTRLRHSSNAIFASGYMQNLQSAAGHFRPAGPRLDRQRKPPRGRLEAGRHRARRDLRHRRPPAQGAGRHARSFAAINGAVDAIAAATRAGTSFVFGYLGGGQLPFELKIPGANSCWPCRRLPLVLVMSVLTTLLFYWRILPPIVRGFSWSLERTLGVGGAVGLSTAANIFLGMVEAPLFIRPYLASLTRSELFMVMTGGMAGIAGTVLVLYATILARADPRCRRAFHHRLGAGRAGRHPRSARSWCRIAAKASIAPHADRNCRRSHRAPWTRSSKAPPPASSFCSTSAPC